MPWTEDCLSEETHPIISSLATVNERGILTINSQPSVNGSPSTHPVHGWGIANGYIYQKVRFCFRYFFAFY